MPVRPAQFIQFTCNACGCSCVVPQYSDALMAPDHCVNKCNAKFDQRNINIVEASILQPDLLVQMVKRFLGNYY